MDELLSALIGYLADETDLPVSSEVPATKPSAFVVLGPAGGASDLFTRSPLYGVSVYAGSDFAAAVLLDGVLDLLLRAHEAIDEVCRVEVQSTYRADLDDMHGWTGTVSVLANRL